MSVIWNLEAAFILKQFLNSVFPVGCSKNELMCMQHSKWTNAMNYMA